MAQGRKAGYKRVRSKNTSDKGAKRTKSIKRRIISSISSTALTKLKSLRKFKSQPEVQLGQNLGPFDKIDEKLHLLGISWSDTEKLQPTLNNTK